MDATVDEQKLPCDARHERGPFDVIGDVHGCAGELHRLLEQLGYTGPGRAHPAGRRALFLGDLVDRGPDVPGVLRTAMAMVRSGIALAVTGNHDAKLLKKLRGRQVALTHGLAESVAQLAREPAQFVKEVEQFIAAMPPHLVLDGGALVAAHAGLRQDLHGQDSPRARSFALFGDVTGEVDAAGLPVRRDWAARYRGEATVVYGHTPVAAAAWVNNTACIDTGCVFGGSLTAARYPEREFVSVPAARVYCQRPAGEHGQRG